MVDIDYFTWKKITLSLIENLSSKNNVRVMYKSTNNIYWRQIMAFDNINMCQLLKGMNTIPLITYYRDFFFEIIPNLPRSCPYLPGKYYTYNISIINDATGKDVEKTISPTAMPNGIYRTTLRYFTEEDKDGVCFWFHLEKYDVKNVENAL